MHISEIRSENRCGWIDRPDPKTRMQPDKKSDTRSKSDCLSISATGFLEVSQRSGAVSGGSRRRCFPPCIGPKHSMHVPGTAIEGTRGHKTLEQGHGLRPVTCGRATAQGRGKIEESHIALWISPVISCLAQDTNALLVALISWFKVRRSSIPENLMQYPQQLGRSGALSGPLA